MARPRGSSSDEQLVAALLDRHGTTFADEAGIKLGRGTPAALWQLLVLSLLLGARIGAPIAVAAARAVKRQGWTTARKLSASSWERRAKVLNEAGYARYDERTATMLGDAARLALDDYNADIFLREAQAVWDETRPYFDRRLVDAAARLGLPKDPRRLARTVDDGETQRLAAALIRAQLARDFDDITTAAGAMSTGRRG